MRARPRGREDRTVFPYDSLEELAEALSHVGTRHQEGVSQWLTCKP